MESATDHPQKRISSKICAQQSTLFSRRCSQIFSCTIDRQQAAAAICIIAPVDRSIVDAADP
jgi:hypothetical protein